MIFGYTNKAQIIYFSERWVYDLCVHFMLKISCYTSMFYLLQNTSHSLSLIIGEDGHVGTAFISKSYLMMVLNLNTNND